MTLATGVALRDLHGKRLSGEDGYYDAFELAFFAGSVLGTMNATIYASPLVVFPLTSPWASYTNANGTLGVAEQTQNTINAGVCTWFMFTGLLGTTRDPLQGGRVTKPGLGGDIQFSETGWPIGLPITLKSLVLRPPTLQL